MDTVIKDNLDDFIKQFSSDEMEEFVCAAIDLIAERFSLPYGGVDPDEAYDIILTQIRKRRSEMKKITLEFNRKEGVPL